MNWQSRSLFLALLLIIAVTRSASQCALGYYCPADGTGPIACDASKGDYCPTPDLVAPLSCYATEMDQESTYCPNWWTIDICPSGHWCSSSGGPYECSAGNYAKSGAWSCSWCFSLFLTSNSGSSSCNKPAIPLIFLLCAASFVCLIGSCGLFWICRACFAGQSSAVVHTADAQRRNEAAQVAAAEAARIKSEQEAADRLKADQERPQVKQQVMERLMREIKYALELRYPQSLQMAPTTLTNSNSAPISASMPPELQRLIQGLNAVPYFAQSPLQSYEQFLSESLSAELDTLFMCQALDALVLQPQSYNQIEFHQAVIGIRPMIVEAFPSFTALERGDVAAASMNFHVPQIPVGVGERIAARNAIQQRLSQELQQYVAAWMQRSKVGFGGGQPNVTYFTQPPVTLAQPVNVPAVSAFQLPNSVPQASVPMQM